MKKAFLNTTPESFQCPYCGSWHATTSPAPLGARTSPLEIYALHCNNMSKQIDTYPYRYKEFNSLSGICQMYVQNDILHYAIRPHCGNGAPEFKGQVNIADIKEVEDYDSHQLYTCITFDISISGMDTSKCSKCFNRGICKFSDVNQARGRNVLTISFRYWKHNVEVNSSVK